MEGLGYRGVRAERAKVKPETVAPVAIAVEAVAEPVPDAPAEGAVAPEAVPEAVAGIAPEAVPEPLPAEMEVFYTFTWAPRPRHDRAPNRGPRPEGEADRPRNPRPPRQGHGPRHGADRQPAAPAAEAAAPAAEGATAAEATRPDGTRGDRPRPRQGGGKPQGEGRQGERHGGGGKPAHDRGERKGGGEYKGSGERRGGGGKPDHGKPEHGKSALPREDRPKTYEARPPRVEKPIDPDNPFAVLAALKGRV
jgi:ATP-dependent RNA helicase SUPV3L1/SUV3